MASLHLNNLPEELLKRLELAARARHRDVTHEVIERLDDSFGPPRVATRRSHDELKELAKHLRGNKNGAWPTPEIIRMAKEQDLSEQTLLSAIRRERQELAQKGINMTLDDLTRAKIGGRK